MPAIRHASRVTLTAAGVGAALVAGTAFVTTWSLASATPRPSPASPDDGPEGSRAEATLPPDSDTMVVTDGPDPAAPPFDVNSWFQADELHELATLPPGTETGPLLTGTAHRESFFGVGGGGDHITISRVTEEDGEQVALAFVRRKTSRESNWMGCAAYDFAEWWRLNADGTVTFLRAKPSYELTADDLPPTPPQP